MVAKVLVIACVGVMATARAESAVFPVQYSLTERYLVDQTGAPFPILGRTAWFVTSLSVADYRVFIDDTEARGYKAIELHVVNHDSRGNNPPFNGNGDRPFLNRLDGATWNGSLNYSNINNEAPDFSTPNEAYWNFVDGLLSYCESKGMLVFMFPAYAGFGGGSQGWMQEMVANGPGKMQSYGAWIATRYQSRKNVVWMMGGDIGSFTAAQSGVESALLNGLKSVNGQQSIQFSAEWDSGMIATDQESFGGAMTLNGTYSFSGDVNNLGRRAYAHMPVKPAFLLEEPYDEEGADGNGVNPSATQPVRRFQWWGWLSTTGGYISGNGYVWPFRAPAWHDHLETQGSRDMARLNAFIGSIKWYKLVPSGLNGMRTLITAGGGASVSSSDYVAAEGTYDGTLIVAYIPPAHSGAITVDMTAMSSVVKANWFDPTSGTYSEIGSGLPNTGTRVFTPPGNNSAGESDWVLIIERIQPPDTEPPVVTLTAPKGGAIVGNSVLVSATATDNIGIVGVRFQVDGVNLGAEVLSPPYSVTWNTPDVSNGTHTVRAIARDLADNNVSNSVSVTVNNNTANSLVAAYGFNEGAGATVSDASLYGNTGTINGATWNGQGRFGSALNFNGGGNWVTVNDSSSLDLTSRMTLEAWVNPTMITGTWATIALKEVPPGDLAYMMQVDPTNHPIAYITTDAGGLQGAVGPQALALNTWTHVAATYDGTMVRLYVGGTVVASTSVSGNIITSGGPLRFGGNAIWDEYFVGAIDEVRIYNRALSPNEIQADIALPITLPTPTPPTINISGNTSYCSNPSVGPVPSVMLTLTGSMTTTVATDASGNYQFPSLAVGGTYSVTPSKAARNPGTPGTSINTIDVIATQRHFLFFALLSGCRLAAADVNIDGSINTIDAIAMQRFYLGQALGIANVGKYRFVPAARSYSGVTNNQLGQNFDTLVFGDVAPPFVEREAPPPISADRNESGGPPKETDNFAP